MPDEQWLFLVDEDRDADRDRDGPVRQCGWHGNREFLALLGCTCVGVAVVAKVMDETTRAEQVPLLVVEPGEDLQLEHVADVTGDLHRTGNSGTVEGGAFENEALVKWPPGLEDLPAARTGRPDADQFGLPAGCCQSGKRSSGCRTGGRRHV